MIFVGEIVLYHYMRSPLYDYMIYNIIGFIYNTYINLSSGFCYMNIYIILQRKHPSFKKV